MSGIGAIDAFYGDRERAVFEFCYPAFFFQVPELTRQSADARRELRHRLAAQPVHLDLAVAGGEPLITTRPPTV